MLKGRLRLTLRPLLKRVPVVGAVQASGARVCCRGLAREAGRQESRGPAGAAPPAAACLPSCLPSDLALLVSSLPAPPGQVSFVEQPEFDFDLTMGGSTDVPFEPALKSWLKT